MSHLAWQPTLLQDPLDHVRVGVAFLPRLRSGIERGYHLCLIRRPHPAPLFSLVLRPILLKKVRLAVDASDKAA